MSNIKQLSDHIRLYKFVSYNEIEKKALEINKNWRESSWTRELRRQPDILAVGKDKTMPVSGHNPIVAYEFKKRPKLFNKNGKLELLKEQITMFGKKQYYEY